MIYFHHASPLQLLWHSIENPAFLDHMRPHIIKNDHYPNTTNHKLIHNQHHPSNNLNPYSLYTHASNVLTIHYHTHCIHPRKIQRSINTTLPRIIAPIPLSSNPRRPTIAPTTTTTTMPLMTSHHIKHIRLATWNVNRQTSFTTRIHTYALNNLDLLHFPEPLPHLSSANDIATKRLNEIAGI